MSTDPQPSGAKSSGPTSDERTRDLRRPSVPNRPPAAVRPGSAESKAVAPAPGRSDAALPAAETVRLEQPSPEALPRQPDTIAGQPTDKLSSPAQARHQTLAFDAPEGGSPGPAASGSPSEAPAPGVPRATAVPSYPPPGTGAPSHGTTAHGAAPAPTRPRRWPWVVLILLPILVIAVSGVLLFLLLGGA